MYRECFPEGDELNKVRLRKRKLQEDVVSLRNELNEVLEEIGNEEVTSAVKELEELRKIVKDNKKTMSLMMQEKTKLSKEIKKLNSQ